MSNLKIVSRNIPAVVFRQQRYCKKVVVKCPTGSQSAEDAVTHTGQRWDSNDYRLARFVDKIKLINPNFAIKLIAQVPPKPCEDTVVWCDGGGGPKGHPKVYINLSKPGNHACGYCGLRFFLKDGH